MPFPITPNHSWNPFPDGIHGKPQSRNKKEVLASSEESSALINIWEAQPVEGSDSLVIPQNFDRIMLTKLKTKGFISVRSGSHVFTTRGKKAIRNHVLSNAKSTFDAARKKDRFIFAGDYREESVVTASSKETKSASDVKLISIADNPVDQSVGLKYRSSIGDNEGMLFAFAHPQNLSFWMQNTFVPLDIAFIDENHNIKQIESMVPLSTKSTRSHDLCKYALEVPRGFFAKHRVGVGHLIEVDADNKVVSFKNGN